MSEVWVRRFIIVALVNTLIAIGWLMFPLFVDQRISRTIAGGSAGTWGYLGFVGFLIVGVLGFAVFASFYYMVPKITKGKINKLLAWTHLILMETGVIGSTTLFGLAGYIGGITILEETAKKTAIGEIMEMVHSKIAFFVEPITAFVVIAIVGVLAGLATLLLAYFKKH